MEQYHYQIILCGIPIVATWLLYMFLSNRALKREQAIKRNASTILRKGFDGSWEDFRSHCIKNNQGVLFLLKKSFCLTFKEELWELKKVMRNISIPRDKKHQAWNMFMKRHDIPNQLGQASRFI